MAWCDAANSNTEYRRKLYTVIIALFSFALSIILVQSTGLNLSHLWYQSTCGALMVTCLIELVAIVYGYGFRRFLANIESMLIGRKSELKHSIPLLAPCFYLITPSILLFSIVLKIGTYRNLIGGYLLPLELELYGRLITFTCLLPIPATLICHLYKLRSQRLITEVFKPTANWGPIIAENRERNKEIEEHNLSKRNAKK